MRRRKSESVFQRQVERHTGLVYASALRQVRDAQLAQDVAQAVFILLARQAGSLRRGTVLPGWLFQTMRFVAARALRAEQRRERRELEAFNIQQLIATDENWQRMALVIDEALAQLGRADHDAILLRYVEGRSLASRLLPSSGKASTISKSRIWNHEGVWLRSVGVPACEFTRRPAA